MSGEAPLNTPRPWDGRTRSGLGIRLMFWLFRVCGPVFAYSLLYPVVFYYICVAWKHGAASRDYLRRLYPTASSFRLLWLNYRHFLSFGRVLLDRAYAFTGALGSFHFERVNSESITEALKAGKGLVLISAHMGNWELAAHGLGSLGVTAPQVPINLVWFRNEGQRARQHLEKVAQGQPFNIIDSSDPLAASIEMVAALKRGEIVAIHGDRVVGSGTVKAPFLGSEAAFPSGPYVVAANTGAPVVFVFCNRLGHQRYRVMAVGPKSFVFGSRRERESNLRQWAGEYALILEQQLREFPLQWHNFYRFWG